MVYAISFFLLDFMIKNVVIPPINATLPNEIKIISQVSGESLDEIIGSKTSPFFTSNLFVKKV